MATALNRISLDVAVDTLADQGLPGLTVATEMIFADPALLPAIPRVLFCLPGGGNTRGYFDLRVEADNSFSFAEAMAGRGHIVVLIDHLGIGGSSQPEDGYLLHPSVLAEAAVAAIDGIKARLREGGVAGLPPLAEFKAIGVGHSMGAMLSGLVQGRFSAWEGVVLLGAGPYGLEEQLFDQLKVLVNDPERTNRELVDILRATGVDAYLDMKTTPESKSMFNSGDKRGVSALREVRCHVLFAAGAFSMVPGSWAPEAAAIDVPVMLAFGDQDICDDPYKVPAYFTATPHLTLVVLPEAGHSHFVFPSREILFRRVADWLQTVPG